MLKQKSVVAEFLAVIEVMTFLKYLFAKEATFAPTHYPVMGISMPTAITYKYVVHCSCLYQIAVRGPNLTVLTCLGGMI